MDLIADRGRRVTVDELNTTRLLAHARQQAVQRKLDDVLIVDVDAPPLRERVHGRHPSVHGERGAAPGHHGRARAQRRRRGGIFPSNAGSTQDMGGRVTRYPLRASEKVEGGRHRDICSASAGWTP